MEADHSEEAKEDEANTKSIHTTRPTPRTSTRDRKDSNRTTSRRRTAGRTKRTRTTNRKAKATCRPNPGRQRHTTKTRPDSAS